MEKVNITEAEWKVMKVLWDRSPLTLKEITSAIRENTSWKDNTIRTLIVRLMEKGVVEADKSTGIYKYSPIIDEIDIVKTEAKSFLKRVFDGSLSSLVATLVKDEEISKEERQEIIDIISKMEERK